MNSFLATASKSTYVSKPKGSTRPAKRRRTVKEEPPPVHLDQNSSQGPVPASMKKIGKKEVGKKKPKKRKRLPKPVRAPNHRNFLFFAKKLLQS